MKIAVFSDVHITLKSHDPSEKFEKGYNLLKKEAGEFDALFISGDLTDYGKKEEIEKFKASLDKVLTNEKLFFSMGNHDIGYSDSDRRENVKIFNEVLKDYLIPPIIKDEFDEKMAACGNTRWDFNGVGIIAICPTSYPLEDIPLLDKDAAQFLRRSLEEFSDRPCYLLIHTPVLDTVFPYARNFWSCGNIFDIINKYNNVLLLSGHIHHPLQDERALYLGNFSAIACPSSVYVLVLGGFIETFKTCFFPDAWNFAQGMYLDVDGYDVKCRKFDIMKEKEIKSPWEFKIGQKDFREIPKKAPLFTKEMIKLENGNIEFSTNDYFHHFVIKINDNITKVCSGFYNCPNGKSNPLIKIPLSDFIKEKGDYTAEIFAVDFYDNQSEKVFLDFTYNMI